MIKLTNQRGSTILIALCLLLMLTLIGIMAVNTSTTDIDLAFNKVHSEQAFYIAEAGAQRAIAILKNDKTWDSGFANVGFNGGTYTVTVIDSSTDAALFDSVLVTSQGTAREASAIVELTLVPGIYHPFRFALFGDSAVETKNSMNTDSYNSDSGSYAATQENLFGDVGSNGVVTVKNGAFVGGDAVTSQSGGLDINPGATIAGVSADDVPEQEIPPVPQSEFDAAAISNDNLTGITGSYSYDPGSHAFETANSVVLTGGTYYFSSFILKNSADLSVAPGASVTIYVTGDIEIKNSGGTNVGGDPADLIFYSQGDIVLKNSSELRGVFYSSEGEGDLRNSADFYGSVVAQNIVVHNSANFHYDRHLGNITFPGAGDLAVVAWRQL